MSSIKKIAITTGGGDAPGLNAVIRAAVLSAIKRGWECVGIREGYNGIMFPENYPDGDGIIRLALLGIGLCASHVGGQKFFVTLRDAIKYRQTLVHLSFLDENARVNAVDSRIGGYAAQKFFGSF